VAVDGEAFPFVMPMQPIAVSKCEFGRKKQHRLHS
jgi:hypothetical protein